MSRFVIGIEGFVPPDAVVVWGAAALSDGQRLINSHTHLVAPLAEAQRLREERHLHLFTTGIELRDEHDDLPLVVVMVNRESDKRDYFLADTGRLGGLVAHRHAGGWQQYIFVDSDAFGRYAKDVADAVVSDILYAGTPASEGNREVVRLALILAPGNPALNAVRVYLSENNNNLVERMARASVRPPTAVSEFELLLRALRSQNDEYELKYEEGAAAGGGFDVDVAVSTLSAIQLAHRSFKPTLQRQFPFIKEIPSPRFREMKAASAELHFVSSVAHRPLGDRVARYLSLHFLEETLRGATPENVPQSRDLQQAIHRIAQPSTETRLSQKRLEKVDREEVTYVATPRPAVERSDVLKVLGIVSGLEQDFMAELAISPSWRLSVSTVNNGDGDPPIGAEATRGAAFLRKAFVFSIIRENRGDGTERFFLIEMRALGPDVVDEVTAMPSSVVPEAFMTDLRLTVQSPNAETMDVSELGTFEEVPTGTLATGQRFLKAYAERCKAFELAEHPFRVSWLPPHDPKTTAVGRALVALNELGGEAFVPDVVATINRLFNTTVRVNNTRREVIRHPDLLEFHPDDDSVMRLTAQGRSFYSAYVAAGGPTAEF